MTCYIAVSAPEVMEWILGYFAKIVQIVNSRLIKWDITALFEQLNFRFFNSHY